MTPREKNFWVVVACAAGAALLLFLGVKFFDGFEDILDEGIKANRDKLSKLQPEAKIQRDAGESADRRINEYRLVRNNLAGDLEEVKKQVGVDAPLKIYTIDPKYLAQGTADEAAAAWNTIYEDARKNLPPSTGGIIPYDLGMPPKLEKNKKNLEMLQYQLSILDEFARLARQSGVLKIGSIVYVEPQDTGTQTEKFIREYPLSFEMECSQSSLFKLLYSLRSEEASKAEASGKPAGEGLKRFARFFIIRNLSIKPINPSEKDPDKQILSVGLTVAVMKFLKAEELRAVDPRFSGTAGPKPVIQRTGPVRYW